MNIYVNSSATTKYIGPFMHYATRCILKNLSNMAWFIQTLFSLLGLVSLTWLKVTESAKTSSVLRHPFWNRISIFFSTLSISIFSIDSHVWYVSTATSRHSIQKKIECAFKKRFAPLPKTKLTVSPHPNWHVICSLTPFLVLFLSYPIQLICTYVVPTQN